MDLFFFFFSNLKCACCLPLSPCLLDSDESQLLNLDVSHPIAAVCQRTALHNFATLSFLCGSIPLVSLAAPSLLLLRSAVSSAVGNSQILTVRFLPN